MESGDAAAADAELCLNGLIFRGGILERSETGWLILDCAMKRSYLLLEKFYIVVVMVNRRGNKTITADYVKNWVIYWCDELLPGVVTADIIS